MTQTHVLSSEIEKLPSGRRIRLHQYKSSFNLRALFYIFAIYKIFIVFWFWAKTCLFIYGFYFSMSFFFFYVVLSSDRCDAAPSAKDKFPQVGQRDSTIPPPRPLVRINHINETAGKTQHHTYVRVL